MNFLEYLATYGQRWIIDAVVLVVCLVLLITNWKKTVKFVLSHMIHIALFLWLCGMGLYTVGFAFEGTGQSFLSTMFRASISSIKMFIAENDLVEVSPYYKENPHYMTAFACVHFLSLCLAAILIINTLGQRLRNYTMLLKELASCRKNPRHSYVFWDINTPSASLANDIKAQEKDARIIFLIPSTVHDMGEKLKVTQLLNSDPLSGEEDSGLGDRGHRFLTVYIPDAAEQTRRFKWLAKILRSSSAIDFFFLTNDADSNLMLAETFAGRCGKLAQEGLSIGIHVLTKGNSRQKTTAENLILDNGADGHIHWSFIDMASSSVEYLKSDPCNFPVNTFPDEAFRDGRIDSRFNSWILGFGETGYQVFKFLYEFSMFEGMHTEAIRRNFTIFDEDPDTHAGDKLKSCPELRSSGVVTTSKLGIGTSGFWDELKDNADTLNCISIALGNDESGLKFTRDIYRHLLQFGTGRKVHTKIYVRIYSPEYIGAFQALARKYNSSMESSGLEIVPFGAETEIFTTALILKDKALKKFMTFNHRFDIVRGKNTGLTAEECWEKDFNISKYTSLYDDVTVALDELERRKAQCYSSAYFTGTILRLAGCSGGEAGIEQLMAMTSDADGTSDRLIDVLVRTVYLREKASHRLLGFSACPEQYEKAERSNAIRHKKTPYLLPWEELSEAHHKLFLDILKTNLQSALEN